MVGSIMAEGLGSIEHSALDPILDPTIDPALDSALDSTFQPTHHHRLRFIQRVMSVATSTMVPRAMK